MSVYRTKPETDAQPPASRELVYEAIDRASTQSSAVVLFKILAFPAILGMVLSVSAHWAVVGVAVALAFGYGVWSNRRGRERATLRIEAGRLSLARSAAKPTELALSDVRTVELDIKKIQRVQEGSSAVPAVRFIDSSVGPEIDTARVVIVTSSERILLSNAFIAHIDAIESLGKIRVFLRGSGWMPEDERAPSDVDDEEDDEEVASGVA